MSIEGIIHKYERFVHIRTGDKYTVLETGLMKIGSGEWVPSVVYTKSGEVFTRDEAKFRENFERRP
jgi:hypothetical protein